MSQSLRVLIADDSAVVRRIVGDVLQDTPGIDVAATARNGREALTKIEESRPDVILLDVEMPVMNGIEALRAIRQNDRRTPVVMFSSLTVRGGEATLDALSLGASDYVPKPSGRSNIQETVEYIKTELVPRILQWSRGTATPLTGTGTEDVSDSPSVRSGQRPVDVVAVGASTGGPNALASMVASLPEDLAVPMLIVQHMPELFTKLLAERIDRTTHLQVREARDGDEVVPGRVLIAPGDYHMTVQPDGLQHRVVLNQEAKEHSCRPAVDVLFRSVASVYGNRSLGVVLTGMGRDGVEGCRALNNTGATVFVQDEASSVVWGMPRAVEEAGLADRVLPLDQMHLEIARQAYAGRRQPALSAS